jgi:hypothetical protein
LAHSKDIGVFADLDGCRILEDVLNKYKKDYTVAIPVLNVFSRIAQTGTTRNFKITMKIDTNQLIGFVVNLLATQLIDTLNETIDINYATWWKFKLRCIASSALELEVVLLASGTYLHRNFSLL